MPPVARRSSWSTTTSPSSIASRWISMVSTPYSLLYDLLIVSAGNLPGFLTGTNPALMSRASIEPPIKPRDSIPTTFVTPSPSYFTFKASAIAVNASGFLKAVVRSLNTIPFCGKSRMSRISFLTSSIFILY